MIAFSERKITINGTTHELEYPITQASEIGDQVVVLYDPDSFRSKLGQFPNLIAVARDGTIRWRAELPTTTTGDRYYRFTIDDSGLVAASVMSEVCELDLANGKIRGKEFVK